MCHHTTADRIETVATGGMLTLSAGRCRWCHGATSDAPAPWMLREMRAEARIYSAEGIERSRALFHALTRPECPICGSDALTGLCIPPCPNTLPAVAAALPADPFDGLT